MEEPKNKEKIYCIFNSEKEDINASIRSAFEIYIKTKEEVENEREIH